MRKSLIIGIILVLLTITSFPVAPVASNNSESLSSPINQPEFLIQIVVFSSGFSTNVCINITNIGDEAATNVECKIYFQGKVFIGKDLWIEDPIKPLLEPNETWTVYGSSELTLGIGPVKLIAEIIADNIETPIKITLIKGFMLGVLIFGIG